MSSSQYCIRASTQHLGVYAQVISEGMTDLITRKEQCPANSVVRNGSSVSRHAIAHRAQTFSSVMQCLLFIPVGLGLVATIAVDLSQASTRGEEDRLEECRVGKKEGDPVFHHSSEIMRGINGMIGNVTGVMSAGNDDGDDYKCALVSNVEW